MVTWNNELYHYGMPRRSGRYKWGSGKDPYHHGADAAFRKAKADYKANKKAINKEHRKSLRNVKDYRKVDSMVKNYKDARRTNKEAYAQAKKAYKQTAEYRRSRNRKIIAGALGATAAATAAYLYKNPQVVDDMKKYVSSIGKNKPIKETIPSRQEDRGAVYKNRMLGAYRRFDEHGSAYRTKVLNNRTRRYGAPKNPRDDELFRNTYSDGFRILPHEARNSRNIRRLNPSSYRTNRNSDFNSGRAAYRPTFTTSQHGAPNTGRYNTTKRIKSDTAADRKDTVNRYARRRKASRKTSKSIPKKAY